ELLVIEQPSTVGEHRKHAVARDEAGVLVLRVKLDGLSLCVHDATGPLEGARELERRVADDVCERLAKTPWRRRLRQLQRKPGDGATAGAGGARPAGGGGARRAPNPPPATIPNSATACARQSWRSNEPFQSRPRSSEAVNIAPTRPR